MENKYIVISGDTLSKICIKIYGRYDSQTLKQVMADNNIINPNKINVGQVIKFFTGEPKVNNIQPVQPVASPLTVIPQSQAITLAFLKGVANLWNDSNTKRVREIIKDVFGGGINRWDLQCTEYVCFKIRQKGIIINWPVKQGRDGGKWADIFIKYGMYKILENPKEGCAMCFTGGLEKTSAKNTGHIAYVEKVNNDESIYISEANWPGSGKYNERNMQKKDWKDRYKAKFVDFS